ncbi:glutamate 5-kinase [Candidatus Sulfurimonas marisnigri]|uniref:Glutamate 5-kinase n=1 Tax=Candidatus Sulfurimonas marisnigri TaxID=2740405 RepID=A0A7S7M0J9_9BACT|nr:glutamate 5-kinase [Candidatus Sulfurimonas marisnigri]QOY54378.1 glutamate 5-kinase [Candidatus Sulfurimonas marisnigri]
MKRIVFKVGSSVLTETNFIAKERMLNLVSLIVEVQKKYEVVLVTSGAVAAGYTALKLDRKKQISKKVLAAVGQPILMSSYKSKFDIYGVDIAQILLTEDDFDSREHTKIFQEIINRALENNILPIVNENDISTTPEQLFGDNDQLSAHVSHYIDADMLIILSDIDGYYDDNPHENPKAKIRKIVNEIKEEELLQKHTPNNEFATGGIVTKLQAAQHILNKKRKMFLCSGFDLTAAKEFLIDGVHNKGTLFENK